MPVLIITLIAIVQFALSYLQQDTMSNRLFDIASSRDDAAVSMSQAQIRDSICSKLSFVKDCKTAMLVEMAPVAKFATGAQPVTGTLFESGAPGDAMLLRAKVKAMNILPGAREHDIEASAVFARDW